MKTRNKLLTLLLCAALITVNLPINSSAVYATDAADTPSKTAYADKKGLQENYDLVGPADGVDNKPVQRVFFGKNGNGEQQKWKIVGKDTQIDGDNIVLFADSAMMQNIQFEPWDLTPAHIVKSYTKDQDTSYSGSTPAQVNINHYGASKLRSELKGMLKNPDGTVVTKYFTEAQQALMNETTITTNDTKNKDGDNKDRTYTTKDILYAPYGYFDPNNFDTNPDCQYVTVGTNNKGGNLNNGLKIDKSSWPANTYFWLRAPDDDYDYGALVAVPSDYGFVYGNIVDISNSVVPAFDLNLTSVIFASAAPAASSQINKAAKITETDDAMTFRWADETGNKIKSTATWNAEEVNVTDNDGANAVYLCVQGKNGETDWIWSQKVSEISGNKVDVQTIADDVKKIDSLSSAAVDLTQCKIWLETTDTTDRLTYAKEAQVQTHSVSITAGTGLEITSGNGTQTVVRKAKINPITVKARSGYHLTAENIKTIKEQLNPSGLTLTEIDAGFNITGKPTKDVNITLPAATLADSQSQGSNGNKGINTGDESSPALWIALMLIALAGASGTAIYTKKKKAK